jgi:hypothetical protein
VNRFEFVETRRAVRREHGDHAGREAAIGNDVDAGGTRLRVEREFRGDDRVVAAEVAEVRARFNRRTRELQVVIVSDATDHGVVAAHQLDNLRRVAHVNLSGRQLLRAPDRGDDGACAFEVKVCDGDGGHVFRVVREIVGRAQPHASCAEYENLHKDLTRRFNVTHRLRVLHSAAPLVSLGWLRRLWL